MYPRPFRKHYIVFTMIFIFIFPCTNCRIEEIECSTLGPSRHALLRSGRKSRLLYLKSFFDFLSSFLISNSKQHENQKKNYFYFSYGFWTRHTKKKTMFLKSWNSQRICNIALYKREKNFFEFWVIYNNYWALSRICGSLRF